MGQRQGDGLFLVQGNTKSFFLNKKVKVSKKVKAFF
jgi:hypothetical protein